MHQVSRNLKKEEHSVYNRLLSIEHDAQYVQSFRKYVMNPLICNFCSKILTHFGPLEQIQTHYCWPIFGAANGTPPSSIPHATSRFVSRWIRLSCHPPFVVAVSVEEQQGLTKSSRSFLPSPRMAIVDIGSSIFADSIRI